MWRKLFLVVMMTLLAGCGSSASSKYEHTNKVNLPKSYKFDPKNIEVKMGDRVTWTNHDDFTHSVRFKGEDPHIIKPGDSYSRVMDEKGTFFYDCHFHPYDMQGHIRVT